MKILIVGDQHFRFQLPYANAIEDGRKKEWDSVISTIHKIAEQCDAVVLLGDGLNSRHNHSSVNREFVEFIKKFGNKEIHIIAGNHERFGKETAIDFLKEIEGWKNLSIYTEPSHSTITAGKETLPVSFLPFMTPGSVDTEDLKTAIKKIKKFLEEEKRSVLFHHHVIEGTKIGGANLEDLNEVILPRKKLEDVYDWIIGGHIHVPQEVSEKIKVTGNIFTQEVGEYEKFVWILDTNEKKFEGIKLPVRGIYKIEVSSNLIDLSHIPSDSIVKCIVTDRSVSIEKLKQEIDRFDASLIIEQYPSGRAKVSVDDSKGLDFSISHLLKVYSEVRNIPLKDLESAMSIIEFNETS